MKIRIPHYVRNVFILLITTSALIPLVVIHCRNKPFSKAFGIFNQKKDVTKMAKRMNDERLEKAKLYLESLSKSEPPTFSKTPELAIVIVTVKRTAYDSSRLGYVLQTVAATHILYVKDKVFLNKTMIICNVDLNPASYNEVVSLKPYIPVVERFGTFSSSSDFNSSRQKLYTNRKYDSTYDKETIDYMFCLESGHNLGAKYVLLIEDDALPMADTLQVLQHKIQYLQSKPDSDFVYIKLFYPLKWQGYGNEISRVLELISIGCICGGISILLHFVFCKRRYYYLQRAFFVCGISLGIVTARIVGRQNVNEFYRISKYLYTLKPSPGCCTPAMMYTRQYIPSLLEFLSAEHNKLHTDLAIYNFINVNDLRAYQIEPNLFHHIGMYTSLTSSERKNAEEYVF